MNNVSAFAAWMVLVSATASAQTITTFAGNGVAGFGGDAGPATQAMINRVDALAVDGAGNRSRGSRLTFQVVAR